MAETRVADKDFVVELADGEMLTVEADIDPLDLGLKTRWWSVYPYGIDANGERTYVSRTRPQRFNLRGIRSWMETDPLPQKRG